MELQWPLMFFTLFVCIGAGLFGAQGLLAALGKGDKIQLPALITSVVFVGLGGIASFLHLEHWERIFNGFGHLTSGITQEMIAIVVFIIAALIYFIVMRRSDKGTPPKWCGVMALVVAIALVFVMAHSYNMAARPIWDTALLWVFYLVNAVLLGGFTLMVIASVTGDEEAKSLSIITSLIGVIAQIIVTAIYVGFFAMASNAYTSVGYYFDPTHPTKAMQDPTSALSSVATGENALLFWIGVVVIGLVVPAITVFLAKRKGKTANLTLYAVIGLVAVMIGGMCFRVILYLLGFSVFVFY